ncbi:MAG: ROK family protein [Dysgonamonadaceae bacterium]|jgi:glucokinase|nr:ROK family protein [Dysgonamonadaceae bacterium]
MKKLIAGIDIGGTNTAFGLVDENGIVHAEGVISTCKYTDFDIYLQALCDAIHQLTGKVEDPFELSGIGVGAPNGNYYTGCIEFAPNLPWTGVLPFVEKLSALFPNTPIALTNDANAAAIGEMIYGGAKGMKNFAVITLGTGLGSGIVVHGEVLYGHDGYAGELGHTIVSTNGRECGCGRYGCLETYASATGIKRTVYKLLADHAADSVLKNISFNELSAEMICTAAINGDAIAREAFAHTGEHLGRALANLVAITSPEAIFLFGGLVRAGKYILEPTKKSMEENMLKFWQGKIKLRISELNEKNAAVLGAAALAWKVGNEISVSPQKRESPANR